MSRGSFLESPEKPFLKLRPAYSVKLVFSYVVKGIKIKITTKFLASRCLRFEDTKRVMSREVCPKSFGTFEKRAPGKLPIARNLDEYILLILSEFQLYNKTICPTLLYIPSFANTSHLNMHISFPSTFERRHQFSGILNKQN